jgi:hypothetical protein
LCIILSLGVFEERAENLIFVFGLKYRAACSEELVAPFSEQKTLAIF